MLDYVHYFLRSLIFSVVVESLVVSVLCALFKKDKRVWLIASFGTFCTIPYVWFVFPTLFWYSSVITICVGESFAFLFEAALYKIIGKLNWKQALLFSLLANSASYFLGKIFW
jgi:hypothetical protein